MRERVLLTTALTIVGAGICTTQGAESRPNILFLLADDLGYNELGCYGSEVIETPILDQMAAEGMLFRDFHAGNAVSSASRAVLMTGMHSGVNTIRGNKGYNLPNGNTRVALKKEDMTIAEMLRNGGYQTAFIGKWHVEDPCDLSTWAFARGFDYAIQEQWGDTNCAGDYTLNMEYINGLQDSIYYDEKKWDCKDEFRTKLAFDYIDKELDVDNPFFLFMSYRAPHAHEWYINEKSLYADRGWPENERMHAAKVTLLDREIGKLIAKLDDMGLMDNTLVLLTSDNGPHNEGHDYEFHDANGKLRGFKRDMYEGGHRVPCLAYWRGKIAAGSVSDFVGSGQDFMATLAEAAQIETPQQSTGVSLIPILTGGEEPNREQIYWEIYDGGLSRQALRMGQWKAVRYAMDQPLRLYNLDDDIGESCDVAAENPEIIRRMEPLFESMRTEDPLFPRHNSPAQWNFIKTKPNATPTQGWHFMRSSNNCNADDGVNITTPRAKSDRAVVNVEYKLNALDQRSSTTYNFVVRSVVYDDCAIEVARTAENRVIEMGRSDFEYSQQLTIDNPTLWSDKEPTIYYLRSEIVLENKVMDAIVTPFKICGGKRNASAEVVIETAK